MPLSPSDDVASWAPLDPAASRLRLSSLLAGEAAHMPLLASSSLSSNPLRHNAVNWILNVIEFYRFSPVTACLAVNYLDRFLSFDPLSAQNEESGDWPIQLLSVACVSVAAKMEETRVPLLSDLQVADPKFVFGPETVARMELLLMSALNWRMRSVTPFDFFEHFGDLMMMNSGISPAALISRAGDLILRTLRVVDFSVYRPSERAAAAIVCAAKEIPDISDGTGTVADLLASLNEWIHEETVRACVQLMEASVLDTCSHFYGGKPLLEPRTPQSPVGVIDAAACGSCDSRKSSAVEAGPSAKRRRLLDSLCTEESREGHSKMMRKKTE